jgi:hypothetical protein
MHVGPAGCSAIAVVTPSAAMQASIAAAAIVWMFLSTFLLLTLSVDESLMVVCYSVVLPTKCSSEASAADFVARTTPSACSGGAYIV